MRRITVIIATAVTAFMLHGCGVPATGEPWLAVIGSDTLGVSGAAAVWNDLDAEQREAFLWGVSPSRAFVGAAVRKDMLQRELHALGYLDAPPLTAFGESWLRIENAVLTARLLQREAESLVTGEDISRFRSRPERRVWFTVEPNTSEEVHYPEVDMRVLLPELYMHLDSLVPGSSGTDVAGEVIRLDSLAPRADTREASVDADSADTWWIASQRIRLFMIEGLQIAVEEYSFSVDSSALKRFALLGADSTRLDSIVVRSAFRDWTESDLQYEIGFLDTMMPVQPGAYEWLCFLMEGIALHSYLLEFGEEHHPGSLDSLRSERDAWMENTALEQMYAEVVSARVEIGEAEIRQQYEMLEEPFMFEERRILETAIIPEGRMADFESLATAGEVEEMIADLQPLQRLSDDSTRPRISRPLRSVEVPAGLGEIAFQLALSDSTSWNGPYPIDEADGYILFRLAGVVPTREAEMEEILYDLEVMAERRLSESAVSDWMMELEQRYGVVLNYPVLDSLPPDPGQW